MSVVDLLHLVSIKLQAETGAGGFSSITLTDEAYDKLVLELGATKVQDSDGFEANLGIKLYLSDGYVMISRESRHTDYGRALREAP